ncbi:MAG: hypothetical protein ABJF09_13765 [Qipengyuania citrea]|jgi:hypothetical protein|uniref:Uncharacterized protein n=3 Tax=Erythrobacteraceae TaxID=335929 RepID=A0A6I4U6S6_9SPHN|nr:MULTISPECIES: hypothetical protein [Erythrobacteraceae]MCZ4263912.1 hypothetical protein [Erythrobacter sp. G21629-S1]RZP17798.1 MAG: hypothetical protein EVA34_10295 [Erythrobacter sp.]KNH00932.1 pe-pgrs family protein [Qipengyuania citrea LAMA 915]MCD1589157.1 hypothetical protein [Qipengyuania citrea]MDP7326613.1 hypothetical protein [Qipengyuania citrea]
MTMGRIGCALGRHSIDREKITRVSGQQVGRCRNCKAPMEEVEPHSWAVQKVRDAGLGPRAFM